MIDNIFENAANLQKSNAKDGIEILVNMAKRQELDPWNVNIVDVTDRYLQHLVELKQNNLRLTGRTLLFAAVLLRLKSDVLEGIDPLMLEEDAVADFDDDYDDPDFQDMEQLASRANIIPIDEALERRTSVKLNRKRVVTLKDLIKQLEFYEELERKRSLKNAHDRAKRRIRSYANLSAEDIINLAHDEYIEDSVKRLYGLLEKLFESNEKIELTELESAGMDKISTYIALLFLSADGRVDLVQDEFYSDLYVVADDLKGEHESKIES